MLDHSRSKALGKQRRWVFYTWIGLSIAGAIYLAVAAPATAYFGADKWLVAAVLPVAMFVMLATGIGWLVWLVTSRRRPTATDQNDAPHGSVATGNGEPRPAGSRR